MKILLDTCAVIFFTQAETEMSESAQALFSDPENEIYVSVVTAAELTCAQQSGRVDLPDNWKIWFRQICERYGWNVMAISVEIMEEAWSLAEPIHRDPADRLLIATARLEGMTLLTTDGLILEYPHVRSMN